MRIGKVLWTKVLSETFPFIAATGKKWLQGLHVKDRLTGIV